MINFIAFQIGWWCSVLGAARGWSYAGPLVVTAVVALHLRRSPQPGREAGFLTMVAVVGTAVDSLFASSDLIVYRGGYGLTWLAPPWITAMWLNFGTTIHGSMNWLSGRYALAALLGAIAGPITYQAADGLGAIDLVKPLIGLVFLALTWAIVLPALFRLSSSIDDSRPTRHRDNPGGPA